MPNAFNFSASPFDCLNSQEQQAIRDNVDIAYFKNDEVILNVGDKPSHLFIIIKGLVKQIEDGEEVAVFSTDDCFDGRGLVTGKVTSQFVATEEVVAYQLAKDTVNQLIVENATFGALIFSDISQKLNALSTRQSQHQINSLNLTRISEAFVRPAHYVDATESLLSVVKHLFEGRLSNVLVKDNALEGRVGIFTVTSLEKAILNGTDLATTCVGQWANYQLIAIQDKERLFEALATMIRHEVNRLVVMRGDQILGILEQIDLLSYIANGSSLIVQAISQAKELKDLKAPAEEITNLIKLLHRNGSKVAMIAKLVQELNAKLFEKTWALIASPELIANSCLFVMGSEGRGEQLLKTDQDNGLIISENLPITQEVIEACSHFSNALVEFGYPECPGKIMVNNPAWRLPVNEFSDLAKQWLLDPTPESLMNLAIFMDAHPVCGDMNLLTKVKDSVFNLASDNQFLLARFASAIESITAEFGWWNRLLKGVDDRSNHLNLKKAGIFAIVHGIRSMALEERIFENSTASRIEALIAKNKLTRDLGDELIQTLHFLMELKLRSGLQELEMNKAVSGEIDASRLSSLDRDLLKDCLQVVKRFKQFLVLHFRIEFA